MTTFTYSMDIRRPLPDVWDFLADPANDPVWQGPVIEIREHDEPVRLGSEIEHVYQFLGRRFTLRLVLTEFEPMRRMAVRTVHGPVELRGAYDLEAVPGATRLVLTGETEAHGFFALAEPVFARLARREWASSCEMLRELMEADASVAHGAPERP